MPPLYHVCRVWDGPSLNALNDGGLFETCFNASGGHELRVTLVRHASTQC